MVETRVLPPVAKRIRRMGPGGREEAEPRDDWVARLLGRPQPCSHPNDALRVARGQTEPVSGTQEANNPAIVVSAPPGGEAIKEAPSTSEKASALPSEILLLLKSAKEDAEMMLKIVDRAEEARLLSVQEAKKRATMADLSQEHALQVASQRQELSHVAAGLKTAAARMTEATSRDNTALCDVARLQRAWQVSSLPDEATMAADFQLNIGIGGFESGPKTPGFVVDLTLRDGQLSARMSESSSSLSSVSGEETPRLGEARGAPQIHQALRQLQKSLHWEFVKQALGQELAALQTPLTAEEQFLRELMGKLHLLKDTSVPGRLAYVPAIAALIAAAHRPKTAREMMSVSFSPAAPCSLSKLAPMLRHGYFRAYVRSLFDAQIVTLPEIEMRWLPSWESKVSVLHLVLSSAHMAIMVIRDNSVELEGVFDTHGGIRWAKDSYTRLTRPELPFFLGQLVAAVRSGPPAGASEPPASCVQ